MRSDSTTAAFLGVSACHFALPHLEKHPTRQGKCDVDYLRVVGVSGALMS